MANERNLVPFSERTESEQREIASKAGIASGKARRRKRDMKQKMKLLLSLPAANNDREEMKAMGIEPQDMDNEMVLVKTLFLSAAGGDTKAFDRIMDLLGKSVYREELALRKLEFKRKNESGEDTEPMKKARELLEGIQSVINSEAE